MTLQEVSRHFLNTTLTLCLLATVAKAEKHEAFFENALRRVSRRGLEEGRLDLEALSWDAKRSKDIRPLGQGVRQG